MLLNEIANSKIEFEIIRNTSNTIILESLINGRTIRFFCENTSADTGSDSWSVQFKELTESGKWTFALTSSGAEFQVTSFVVEGLKFLIQMQAPEVIDFTADTKTRGLMYKRVADRFFKSYSTFIRPMPGEAGEYELRMTKN